MVSGNVSRGSTDRVRNIIAESRGATGAYCGTSFSSGYRNHNRADRLQNLLGPKPILFYRRPTEKEKLRLFEFDAFGPYAFAKAALAGGFQQASKSPPEWGSGWDGFGTRVASNFGIQLVTTTTRYGMAEILREDTAYYRCECKGLFPRFGHALISTLMGRHGEDGHYAFSFPGLVSPYAGTMTALAWYPDRYSVKDGLRMGNYNLLGQAAGNVALEFLYGGPHTLLSHIRPFQNVGWDGSGAKSISENWSAAQLCSRGVNRVPH